MFQEHLIQNLEKVLADSYVLYLKTQNYHWNVTGPHFKDLHILFEELYTDLASAIDEIAERIRACGVKVDGTLQRFYAISSIKEGDSNASAKQMLKDIIESQTSIIATLKLALKESQAIEDEVSNDLLIGRMSIHEKFKWMLQSTLD